MKKAFLTVPESLNFDHFRPKIEADRGYWGSLKPENAPDDDRDNIGLGAAFTFSGVPQEIGE
jgi:hypothetical protein